MQHAETEYLRQRARELRAIAWFIDDRRKQETLLWLAHDYENMADDGESEIPVGLGFLVRRLHLMRIAEQLRPADHHPVS